MLSRAAQNVARYLRPAPAPSFEEIPRLSGGACLVTPDSSRHSGDNKVLTTRFVDAAHGLFQRSVTDQPGSVFLVGMQEEEVKKRYPMAVCLEPVEKVGRVSMTPASAMSMLRNLLGQREAKSYLWELFYLEQAGNELNKPGPLAMIPKWMEEQLRVETIASAICGMQRHDASVGAAVRALMRQEQFSFAILDHLQEDVEKGGQLSPKVTKLLSQWADHAASVVASFREILDHPPVPLQYLPAVREAQEGAPGVYYFPESVMTEIAPVLDAIVLSGGLRAPHHWYINVPAVGDHNGDGLNAISRLGAALWQAGDARKAGYGPIVWWELGGQVPVNSDAKTYHHRCMQGSAFIIGPTSPVLEAAECLLNVDHQMPNITDSTDLVAAYRLEDQAFVHFRSEQVRAAQHFGQGNQK